MSERKKATKAIILARVSSKEQEDGYSIDAQTYRLEEYCLRKGLEILQIFKFSESSTIGNREKFKQALDFAKRQKEIIAVVTDKVDRLQRSYKETPLLDALIGMEKIELHFYTENCVIHKYSTSQERMMWNMFTMMAQSYVDSLRDNVNRSIDQKLRSGEWVSMAPIGYLHEKNYKNERGKGTIVIDEARAPMIKLLFETYAKGIYTVPEILKMTKEWGLKNSRGNQGYLCKAHVYNILENPFYYGVMRLLKTKKTYPHIYQPIITKELFDVCQQIRLGRKTRSFKWGNLEFIFRGLIKCAITGKLVSSFTKHKTYLNGNTDQWTYLRSGHPKNPAKYVYTREDKILQEVQQIFDSIVLEPNKLSEVMEYIQGDSDKAYHNARIRNLNSEHTKVKSHLDRLVEMYLDGLIGKEEVETKRKELIDRRDIIVKDIENHNKADNDFSKRLIDVLELAAGASKIFKGSTIDNKRQLINLVLSNLELNGHKLVYTLRPPFDALVKQPEDRIVYLLDHGYTNTLSIDKN